MNTSMKILAAVVVALCTPAVAQSGEQPVSPPLKRIVIVFKTHFDIGYTDLAANVVQKYRTTMIDQALQLVDQNRDLPPERQFAWTIPGWPAAKVSQDWKGQSPDRQQRIVKAIKDGRFVIHALPFTTHTETLELEDLVRGMGFSSRVCRQARLALARDAKMTDVPCHTWAIPTILKHAGVDFLHLGCNAASSSPKVPALFWWEGPDGSRVLTMYSAAGYGTGLAPPKDWPYSTWLALIHTGDNHGPPTPAEVRKLLDQAARTLPGIEVKIGRLSDFADSILAEKREIPVVRGDMPDTWIHGPMCDPAGASLARRTRPLIEATEALGTLLKTWKVPCDDPTRAVAEAYEKSLLYGEHTWGGALYWITKYEAGKVKFGYGDLFKADREAGRFNRLEESWAEHTAYIESADALVKPVLAAEMKALADAVGKKAIVVFNPLPWARSGVVSVPWTDKPIGTLKNDQQESVRCIVRDGRLEFIAADVPAMGYRSWVPVVDAAASGEEVVTGTTTVATSHFKITLDPARGGVASVWDEIALRELVDKSSAYALGQYLYERFDAQHVAAYVKSYVKVNTAWAINELGKPNLPPDARYRAASPRDCKLRITKDDLGTIATMEAAAGDQLPHATTTRVRLYNGQPYFDVEVIVRDKPADAWPEAGWICFPMKADEPRFKIGRLSSIVDPVRDLVPGSNHDLMWLNGGVSVTDSIGAGTGICPMDHALISLDRPGGWKYDPTFTPRKPIVFVNVFNNQWTTNFRMWNQGTWTSRVRVWSAAGDVQRSLVTPAWEARVPLLAAVGSGTDPKIGMTQEGIELSRGGILVTAFGANPDGPGTLLRLWEHAGKGGVCKVRLPMDARSVQPVDLRGRPAGDALEVRNRTFFIEANAFAPVSVIIGH